MHLNLLQKKVIQKTAEVTDDLIGNKIVDKITGIALQSKPEAGTQTEETSKVRFASSEKTMCYYWWAKIDINK